MDPNPLETTTRLVGQSGHSQTRSTHEILPPGGPVCHSVCIAILIYEPDMSCLSLSLSTLESTIKLVAVLQYTARLMSTHSQ